MIQSKNTCKHFCRPKIVKDFLSRSGLNVSFFRANSGHVATAELYNLADFGRFPNHLFYVF